MYLTFIVADVNAAIARLRAAGVSCMTGDERVQSRHGLYIAFVRDPEGNVVELVQYDDMAAYRPDLHS
jgi:catechol 2,3-dioxygenase-like lactoylglutathione lyase family enzyme